MEKPVQDKNTAAIKNLRIKTAKENLDAKTPFSLAARTSYFKALAFFRDPKSGIKPQY